MMHIFAAPSDLTGYFNVCDEEIRWNGVENLLQYDNHDIFDGSRQNWPQRFCHWPPVGIEVGVGAILW